MSVTLSAGYNLFSPLQEILLFKKVKSLKVLKILKKYTKILDFFQRLLYNSLINIIKGLKMAKKKKNKKTVKPRDLNILAGIRGECQIGTIRNTQNKKRYNRKKMKKVEHYD